MANKIHIKTNWDTDESYCGKVENDSQDFPHSFSESLKWTSPYRVCGGCLNAHKAQKGVVEII